MAQLDSMGLGSISKKKKIDWMGFEHYSSPSIAAPL
jgi:hypothetical protein